MVDRINLAKNLVRLLVCAAFTIFGYGMQAFAEPYTEKPVIKTFFMPFRYGDTRDIWFPVVQCNYKITSSTILEAPKYGTVAFKVITFPDSNPDSNCANGTASNVVAQYTQSVPTSATTDHLKFAITITSVASEYVLAHGGSDSIDIYPSIDITLNLEPSSTPTPTPTPSATQSEKFWGAGAVCPIGDPIDAASGNVFETVTDYTTAGDNTLAFTRHYNSLASVNAAFPAGSIGFPLGSNWRSNFDRYLSVTKTNGTPTSVTVQRADGQELKFTMNGAVGVSDSDIDMVLVQSPYNGNWYLSDADDAGEEYGKTNSAGIYLPTAIYKRNGYTQTLSYDASGALAAVVDSNGRRLTFNYSGGLLQAVTTPDGSTVNYTYSASGMNGTKLDRLKSVSYPGSPRTSIQYLYENTSAPLALTGILDELGNRFSSWTYDATGRGVTSQHAGGADLQAIVYGSQDATMTSALGQRTTVPFAQGQGGLKVSGVQRQASASVAAATSSSTYDSNGYIASQTDMNGNTTAYVNDSKGRPIKVTEASGTPLARVTTINWPAGLHLPTQIVEPNRTISFTYDPEGHGNLLARTVTSGSQSRTWTYTYNSLGQILTARDPRGATTTFTYDSKGNRTSITNAVGHVISFTSYDANGRLLAIKDPNNLVSTLAYDSRGRLTSFIAGTEKTTFAYDAAGNLITLTTPDGAALSYSYDAAHRLTGVKDALNNTVSYTLDAAGNLTKVQSLDAGNAVRRTQSMAYDTLGRLIQIVGGRSQTTSFTYDANGNATKFTDALSQSTSGTFDALGRLLQAVDPAGKKITYGYDASDRVASATDPRLLSTTYTFDGLGNQSRITSPDTGTTSRTFDAAGNVATETDARGVTSTIAYDALNRPTAVVFSDTTPPVTFAYDEGTYGVGHLTTMVDGTGTTRWTYDQHGRITQKSQSMGFLALTTSISYDASGRLAEVTYPSGRIINFSYDAAGRVNAIASGSVTLAGSIAYSPWGAVTSWISASQAAYSRTFDSDGRIAAIAYGGTTVNYTFDANNRITGTTETGLPAKNFGYDALGRITSYTSGGTTQSYEYDPTGNRTSLMSGSSITTYGIASTSNRVTGSTGGKVATFTYDAAGNTVGNAEAAGPTYYAYDAQGARVAVVTPSYTVFNAFNGFGQRVIRDGYGAVSPRGGVFIYDEAQHLLGEYDLSGRPVQETVWLDDLPVAVMTQAKIYAVFPDHIGAPHAIADQSGQTVWLWDHDPFGNGLPTGSFTYNLRFPGQYYDAETGLHYNFARDYNPVTGRYLQSDPIGLNGGINTYEYASGNPLSRTDALGLYSFGDAMSDLANLSAGFGDTITFGGTKYIRRKWSIGGVDYHSRAYCGGEFAGVGYLLAATTVGAGAVAEFVDAAAGVGSVEAEIAALARARNLANLRTIGTSLNRIYAGDAMGVTYEIIELAKTEVGRAQIAEMHTLTANLIKGAVSSQAVHAMTTFLDLTSTFNR